MEAKAAAWEFARELPIGHVHAVGVEYRNSSPYLAIHMDQFLIVSPLDIVRELPREIKGIPVALVRSQHAEANASEASVRPKGDRRPRLGRVNYRPVVGGISCSHYNVQVGTVGCVCVLRGAASRGKGRFLLSNRHVFAPPDAKIGDPVLQASPGDGGTDLDRIGSLYRYRRVASKEMATERVDAAIARVHGEIPTENRILGIGRLRGTQRARVGDIVCKHGRNTGYTEGIVVSVDHDAFVQQDSKNPKSVVLFQNQIRIEPINGSAFAQAGDSGAIVVHKDTRKAVGLFFAGPYSGSYGLANHIFDVENVLGIRLL